MASYGDIKINTTRCKSSLTENKGLDSVTAKWTINSTRSSCLILIVLNRQSRRLFILRRVYRKRKILLLCESSPTIQYQASFDIGFIGNFLSKLLFTWYPAGARGRSMFTLIPQKFSTCVIDSLVSQELRFVFDFTYCYFNKRQCDLNQSKDDSFVKRVAKNND